jgi:fructose-1,6-bisphosphatase/inositol monophosphatase family enzyme
VQAGDWLGFLGEIADRADEIALRLFRSADLHVDQKPDRSLVTAADKEIEATARKLLGERSIYGGSLVSTNGLLHEAVLARLRGDA